MLEIFRKNYFLTSVLLLPYIFLLRMGLFMHPRTLNFSEESSLTNILIYQWVNFSYVEVIVTNLIIFIQAFIINYMFLNHKLSRNGSLLPGLFYIVLMSLVYPNTYLNDVLIANTFLIIAVRNIWLSYKITSPTSRIFNIGFNLGLASLIFYPYYILIIFAIIALSIIRSLKVLEFVQFMVSFFAPMFLFFVYNFWMDIPFNPISFITNLEYNLPAFVFDHFNIFHIGLIIYVILILFSLFWYFEIVSKKNMETQKKINILYWNLFFIGVIFILFPIFGIDYLIPLSLPLALFLGMKVSDIRNKVGFEVLHLLLLIVVIISQFNLI